MERAVASDIFSFARDWACPVWGHVAVRGLVVVCVLWPVLSLLSGCATYLGGSASYEPYPHPYVSHLDLPFTEGAIQPATAVLGDSGRISVCDLDSQILTPVGGHLNEVDVRWYPLISGLVLSYPSPEIKDLNCLTELEGNNIRMADVVCKELAACGATTVRLSGDGHPLLLDAKVRQESDLLLRGTVLSFEYSRQGLKKSPYDFLYLAIRFRLHRLRDGALVWQGDVAAYRKNLGSNQQAMATDALRLTVQALAADELFRAALKQARR